MKKTILVVCILGLALGGCAGAKKTPDPIGVGTGVHELKQSPCACVEVPMQVPGAPVEG